MMAVGTASGAGGRSTWHLLLVFGALLLVNTVALGLVTGLAWGLRGVSYEPGRPTASDLLEMRLYWSTLIFAVAVNVGVPLWLLARRRRRLLAAVLAAWLATPVAMLLGLRLFAAAVSLISP